MVDAAISMQSLISYENDTSDFTDPANLLIQVDAPRTVAHETGDESRGGLLWSRAGRKNCSNGTDQQGCNPGITNLWSGPDRRLQ